MFDLRHTHWDRGVLALSGPCDWGKGTCPPPLWETEKGPHCLEVRTAALPWDVRLLTHTILFYLGPRKPQELQEKSELTSKTSLR